jgi:mono/diheme cytochrome c family protein
MRYRVLGVAVLTCAVGMGSWYAQAAAQDNAAKAEAAALYKQRCAMCHGPKGDSKLQGMSFIDGEWKHGTSPKEVATIIREGVPGTAMLGFKTKLKPHEIEALAEFVRAFDSKLK